MKALRLTICITLCAFLIWGNVANAMAPCCCLQIDDSQATDMPCHDNNDSESTETKNSNCTCDHGLTSQIPTKLNTNTITSIKSVAYHPPTLTPYQTCLKISSDPPKHTS